MPTAGGLAIWLGVVLPLAGGYLVLWLAGPAALDGIAERLAREDQDVKGALTLMKLNVETNSDSATSFLMLSQLYLASDQKDKALFSVKRALDLEPDNEFAQRLLQRISPSE